MCVFHVAPAGFLEWLLSVLGELPELRRGGADLQAEPHPSPHPPPPPLPAENYLVQNINSSEIEKLWVKERE